MKYSLLLVASAGWAYAVQDCTGTSQNEGGNWFCGAVGQILYEGIGGAGSFKAVTNMGDDGSCQTETKDFSGPLAPLDEDVRILFLTWLFLFVCVDDCNSCLSISAARPG